MKVTKLLQFFAVILLFAVASTGCRLKPAGTTVLGHNGSGKKAGQNDVSDGVAADPGRGVFGEPNPIAASPDAINTGEKKRDILKAEMINFDVDSAVIKNSEKPKLKRVAEYIKANPTHDILIEGHCDERGTEAYNLALGDKRALAAREYLVSLGAPAKDLYTVSFGETQPIEPLHEDAAYSKNRRCEFVVVLPAN